jgi:hypothetical protein
MGCCVLVVGLTGGVGGNSGHGLVLTVIVTGAILIPVAFPDAPVTSASLSGIPMIAR